MSKGSGVEGELGTLVIVVLKAKNLPDKHSFYKQDPFAIVRLPFIEYEGTTKVDRKGGQHPLWDDEFHIPLPSAFLSPSSTKAKNGEKETDPRNLKLLVYAKEPKKDDLIGEVEVDLRGTVKTGEFDDWVTLKTDDTEYRGEVYLEMTFYKAGPPPSPPASTTKPLHPSQPLISNIPSTSQTHLQPNDPQLQIRSQIPAQLQPHRQPQVQQQAQAQAQAQYYLQPHHGQSQPYLNASAGQSQYLTPGAKIQRRPSKLKPSERMWRAPPGRWIPPPTIAESDREEAPYPPPKDTRLNEIQEDGSSLLVPPHSHTNSNRNSYPQDHTNVNNSYYPGGGGYEPNRIPSVLRPANIKSSAIPIPGSLGSPSSHNFAMSASTLSPTLQPSSTPPHSYPYTHTSNHSSPHTSPHLHPTTVYPSQAQLPSRSTPLSMPTSNILPSSNQNHNPNSSPGRIPPALPPRHHIPGEYYEAGAGEDGREEELPDPYLAAKYSKPAPLPFREGQVQRAGASKVVGSGGDVVGGGGGRQVKSNVNANVKTNMRHLQEEEDLHYARRLSREEGALDEEPAVSLKVNHDKEKAREREREKGIEREKDVEAQRRRQEEAERRLAEKRRQEEDDEEVARRLERELNVDEG